MQIIQLFLSLKGATEITLLKLFILHEKKLRLRKLKNSPRLQRFLVIDPELKFISIQEHKSPPPCVGGAVGRVGTIPL